MAYSTMGEDIIEILSSPEPQQHELKRPSSHPSLPGSSSRIVYNSDIIEIMDSDDEKSVKRENSNHGPSRRMAVNGRSEHSAGIAGPGPATIASVLYKHNDVDTGEHDISIGPSINAPIQPYAQQTTPRDYQEQTIMAPSPLPEPAIVPPTEDMLAAYIAQVLEIIPDVDIDYAHALLIENYENYEEQVVQRIVDILFENPTYPRIDTKVKRKRSNDEDEDDGSRLSVKPRIDYTSIDRPRPRRTYTTLANEQLHNDFPYVPAKYIKRILSDMKNLYAPAYFHLAKQEESEHPPYTRSSIPNRVAGKGRAVVDADFDAERAWVVEHQISRGIQNDAQLAAELEENEQGAAGSLFECGCCFTECSISKMAQCPDGHLFCGDCLVGYAESRLGERNASLLCMDQSGCKLSFAPSQLQRFLTPKLMELYDRVSVQQSVVAANIEGLEECPDCDFKCVIDNPDERLFRCQNEDCLKVTCRKCKKSDHLPKSCEEVIDDRQRGAQHEVDEAMTHALMRNCPKCRTPFVKEGGCNKITCTTCKALSCYLCRKLVSGYNHFSENGRARTKCVLYDTDVSLQARHAKEVEQAGKAKLDEIKDRDPEIELDKVKVDATIAGPLNNNNHLARGPLGLFGNHPAPMMVPAWGAIPVDPFQYPNFGPGQVPMADPVQHVQVGRELLRQREEIRHRHRLEQMVFLQRAAQAAQRQRREQLEVEDLRLRQAAERQRQQQEAEHHRRIDEIQLRELENLREHRRILQLTREAHQQPLAAHAAQPANDPQGFFNRPGGGFLGILPVLNLPPGTPTPFEPNRGRGAGRRRSR